MFQRFVPALLVALFGSLAVAASPSIPGTGAGAGVALTVYNNFGVVQDTRIMKLPKRNCTVSFRDDIYGFDAVGKVEFEEL